jgi:hypothetical protein
MVEGLAVLAAWLIFLGELGVLAVLIGRQAR